jgi:hypothetical protein
MPSAFRIRKRTALVCLLAVVGLGIAAAGYRQYLKTNLGELSVARTSPEIALTIDGNSFTSWNMPVTLHAGSHQFHATWQEYHVDTTIDVNRGDKSLRNRVKYSLGNGQLQVIHNLHLVDVAPRPAPEVYAIQTVSAEFWHTADGSEIALRRPRELADAEPYTIHWLQPDHSEAFIESNDGRFVTNALDPLFESQGFLRLSDGNESRSLFKIDRVRANESWTTFATGEHFVDVNATPHRTRTTRYEVFASPHRLKPAGDSVATKPVPPPPATPMVRAGPLTQPFVGSRGTRM